jgi:hypothetical protein
MNGSGDTQDPLDYDYSRASRCCDIVMKGGITSGVVYPHAVCELAQTYLFKNVGGTSAGAIAAAATAAAERGRATGGFNELAKLPGWIGSNNNLERLFQPQRSTRRLHHILLSAVSCGRVCGIVTAIWRHPFTVLLGMAPGIALGVLALGGSGALKWFALVGGGVLALTLAAIALVLRLFRQVTRAIPNNGYGLCSGWNPPGLGKTEPLTTWLQGRLVHYAGPLPKGSPLTFGDLWAGPGKSDPPSDPAERHVQLEMMTTNLTNRTAHRLPWETKEWFFDPAQFRKLFPEEVVAWMEACPPAEPTQPAERQDQRMLRALVHPLCPLPAPADLPVIVATRMSLSFPVLLSAIPLWRIDMSRKGNQVLNEWNRWARKQGVAWNPLDVPSADWPDQARPASRPTAEPCWFSDGGISSNFPVHFFDRFVPRWPTFAINLRPFHPDATKDEKNQANNTSSADSNLDEIQDWWYRWPAPAARWKFTDPRIGKFMSSVVRTMQNRVDEAQMRAPGYRDRIVHVSLTDDEGGMNLTMPPLLIEALTKRGQYAAGRLVEAYTRPPDPEVISWDNHRWVRLRSTLAVLETMHGFVASGYRDPPVTEGERTYKELVKRGNADPPNSYRMSAAERALARGQIAKLLKLADQVVPGGPSLATDAPKPTPEGRIVPRV